MKEHLTAWTLSSCIVLFALVATGVAFAADAGALATQVQGTVSIAGKDGKAAPARPFAKFQPGDRLTLGTGAKLRIVYANGGRQETWTDAAQIEIGAAESKRVGQGRPPEVAKLPPFLVQTLTRSPEVMAGIQNRQGMVRLRAIAPNTQLARAWTEYDELRRATADDDIGPELHLLVTLQELKAFDDIKEVLAEMLRRQPGNAEVKALNERYIATAAKQ